MTDDTERHPTYEPGPTTPIETTAGVAAEPAGFRAAPAQVAATGPSRTRWAVGLGVAGLAVAFAIGAVVLLGASQSPEALRYIPGAAPLVAEIRLDLPGDQLQKVGNLLAHFPGFRDQSTLGDKLDEAFTQLVTTATDGGLDYRADLKPWLNGPAFAAAPAPSADGPSAGGLVSATTNGAVDCATALKGTVTHETYQGLDIVIAAGSDGGTAVACVVDGRQALLGDPASVRAGLDAKVNGTGMDTNAKYQAARAALGADRIATAFASGSAITELMPRPSLGTDGLPGLGSLDPFAGLAVFGNAVPEWMMVGIRAENDALVIDTVAAPMPAPSSGASQLPLPATHASRLAGVLPADTVLFIEHQGAGVALQNLLATIQADPTLSESLAVLDGLGGAGALLGWIEDAGVAVIGGTGGTPSAGVLLAAEDEAAAAAQVTTLKSLVGLLGLSGGGGGVEVTESTVNGVEVTTIRISDLSGLIPPGTLPDGASLPTLGEPIEFSIAARGPVVLVGVGDGFMTSVLDVQAGASLADGAAYKLAQTRSLSDSRTTVFVAVATGRDLIAGLLPADAQAKWQSDILPYVEPIQAVSMTTSSDDAANRSRVVITVVTP